MVSRLDEVGELRFSDEEWEKILEIRSEVNKHIEEARNNEIIGSSLEAELELYCDTDIKTLLDNFSEELRFIFITSKQKFTNLDKMEMIQTSKA